MKLNHKPNQGFSLLELMVVITIIAIIAGISAPTYTAAVMRARQTRDIAHQKAILAGMRIFATDWDGSFPYTDNDGNDFTTSTEAFQFFMLESGVQGESLFYVKGNPEKSASPNGDGILEPQENCLSYVSRQTDSMSGSSPLTVNEMTGAGTFGQNHPYLQGKRAVVGYVDGHAGLEKLSSNTEGATIAGPPGSGIDNIFQRAEIDENGRVSGGYLAVDPENILHPE